MPETNKIFYVNSDWKLKEYLKNKIKCNHSMLCGQLCMSKIYSYTNDGKMRKMVSISAVSLLSHKSICLFLHQYQTSIHGFINVRC